MARKKEGAGKKLASILRRMGKKEGRGGGKIFCLGKEEGCQSAEKEERGVFQQERKRIAGPKELIGEGEAYRQKRKRRRTYRRIMEKKRKARWGDLEKKEVRNRFSPMRIKEGNLSGGKGENPIRVCRRVQQGREKSLLGEKERLERGVAGSSKKRRNAVEEAKKGALF